MRATVLPNGMRNLLFSPRRIVVKGAVLALALLFVLQSPQANQIEEKNP